MIHRSLQALGCCSCYRQSMDLLSFQAVLTNISITRDNKIQNRQVRETSANDALGTSDLEIGEMNGYSSTRAASIALFTTPSLSETKGSSAFAFAYFFLSFKASTSALAVILYH
jgi:hypothetical protein